MVRMMIPIDFKAGEVTVDRTNTLHFRKELTDEWLGRKGRLNKGLDCYYNAVLRNTRR
jgi:hypothetical protein